MNIDLCRHGDYLEGVMIGWRENIKSIKTQRKAQSSVPEMLMARIELGSDLYKAQSVSTLHMFYWLVGILKWGKDEFISPEGDLIALDLDRSKYYLTRNPRANNMNFTWCLGLYHCSSQ